MRVFGLNITRAKATTPSNLSPVLPSGRGWFPVVRESFPGAWQQNMEMSAQTVLTFSAVYACVTLIAGDIGKLRIKLLQRRATEDIWDEVENPAYSPVLRKPNRYQTRIKFLEQWVVSKLVNGNTYVLKQRNQSNKVEAMYILDPTRVRPLLTNDGAVYYALQTDILAGLSPAPASFDSPDPTDAQNPLVRAGETLVVPASEIIHDVMVPLYHPLVGVSPLTACGLAALQGLKIQETGAQFFGNGANPSGVLTAPGFIRDETAQRLKEYWDTNFTGENAGHVAVLGDGLKYEPLTMKFTEAQMLEQLRWTAENACTAFHVPPYKIGVGPAPSYNNVEALNTEYYSQALQNPIESIELLIDEGLSLPNNTGVELDLDQLMRMDTPTRVRAAAEAIQSAGMSPNEARKKFFGLGRVEGGDTPYMQQQDFSLAALAKRDAMAPAPTSMAPSSPAAPSAEPVAPPPPDSTKPPDTGSTPPADGAETAAGTMKFATSLLAQMADFSLTMRRKHSRDDEPRDEAGPLPDSPAPLLLGAAAIPVLDPPPDGAEAVE